MWISIFVSNCSYFPARCVESLKVIEEVSPSIERNIGENATLLCRKNTNEYALQWMKIRADGLGVSLSYNDQIIVKGRHNIVVSPSNHSYSLVVS